MLYLRKIQPHLANYTKVLGYPPCAKQFRKMTASFEIIKRPIIKGFFKDVTNNRKMSSWALFLAADLSQTVFNARTILFI